jgi:putative tryptophan/tyrosine transport system substrate-binding protein
VTRRAFIVALAGSILARPLVLRAQQKGRVWRIGLLIGATEESDPESQSRVAALRQGLAALGWEEGHNLAIDYRFGGGDAARIHAHVAELVNSSPDLIVANTSTVVGALKQATATIPVVFAVVNDPVGQGFVQSLAHPGGNITGFTLLEFEVLGKWMELLKEMAPQVTRARLLFNPRTAPFYTSFLRQLGSIPATLGMELTPAPVESLAQVETVVAALAHEPGGGLISGGDPFTVANRGVIITVAERYRLPAIYQFRQFAADGGLMSYGPDTADIFRRSAAYIDRILKGEKPADLPVQQPTKFEFVVNLRTARALGLNPPPLLLARADEVIE